MKKILALILAVTMLGSIVVFANVNKTEEDIMLISEETSETAADKRVVEGTVKSVADGQIELEDLVLNIDENTLVADTELIPTEIKEGDLVTAIVSTMTTRSLPPQSYAFYVIVRENAETAAPIYMTVDKVENGLIVSEDGNYEVSFENAEVAMYKTKNIVKAEELTKGSEIFVYADVMTMSIPALVNPTKIIVKSIATSEEAAAEDEIDVVIPESQGTLTIEGTVKAVADGQIELDDYVLNIDEGTLVAGTDLIPADAKVGDMVTAVISEASTLSLPPQSHAYYVIVRKNAEDMAPIHMAVEKVEDGFIYSQDGNYKVSFENAEVGMYKTKNIVKAEELTKGSEIFVYADMMTMSIPALVNPSKIVVMNIYKRAFEKALALNEDGILLGTENGLELERDVTRAEAVTLIQRTTKSARMTYSSDFEDVSKDHWAYLNISWAVNENVVVGVGDNKFEPDRTVTAQELAMMLLNAQGEKVEYEKAFEVAAEKGLVLPEDNISKDDVLTRDAVAKMIYNYCK